MDTIMTLTNVILEHCLAVVNDTDGSAFECAATAGLAGLMGSHSDLSAQAERVETLDLDGEKDAGQGLPSPGSDSPNSVTTITDLPDKTLDMILCYLNPSDLLHSRFVSRFWNIRVMKNSKFLSSTVFQVNTHSLCILSLSSVQWENISICYLHLPQERGTNSKKIGAIITTVQEQTATTPVNAKGAAMKKPVKNSNPPETEQSSPPLPGLWPQIRRFLNRVKYLDFRCSVMSWTVIQRFLAWTKVLEHLSFDRCTLLHISPSPSTSPSMNLNKNLQPKMSTPMPTATMQRTPMLKSVSQSQKPKQKPVGVDEAEANALKKLKTLTVQDIGTVDKMTSILIRLVEKKLTQLERIYLTFDSNLKHFVTNNNTQNANVENNNNNNTEGTETETVSIITTSYEHANVFHRQILQLMRDSRRSLRCLYFNLRDRTLTSTFCSHVLDLFENETIENLEEFQLTPFLQDYSDQEDHNNSVSESDVAITSTSASGNDITSGSNSSLASSTGQGQGLVESKSCSDCKSTLPMLSLMSFLNRHPTLKHVSFPHFNTRSSNDFRRRRMFRNFPKTVEKLNLPGYCYLVPDFLSQLPKLKSIFMGSVPGKPFHPNSYRYAPQVCRFIEEVGVSTRIHLRPGKLVNFAWKFPSLTKLEFDGMRSVVNDLDLQGIILNCPWLRYLSIYGCDLITDFGVTGSALDLCKEIFRLGIIYTNPAAEIPQRTKYKPITTLKGLRTLILRGNSKITDVGIFYGFRFQELKHLWIPYSERITGWGIRQLGCWNPSLEALGVTAVNVANTEALTELTDKHPRISADRILVQSWCEESPSIMSSPSIITSLIDD